MYKLAVISLFLFIFNVYSLQVIDGNRSPVAFTTKQFADGEVYVRIDSDVAHKKVWVIAASNPPAENMMELFLTLDALKRNDAQIHVIFTYFGYARQDRVAGQEALSLEMIANWLKLVDPKKVDVMHIHSNALSQFLDFSNIIPFEFFDHYATDFDVIVAPDRGAFAFAQQIAIRNGKDLAYLEKRRSCHDQCQVVSFTGDITGKNVLLVDDMISTGGTIVNAARTLINNGARSVSVAITHGVFVGPAIERIEKSPIEKVFVTNSVVQKHSCKKIEIFDLQSIISSLIARRS